MGLSNYHLTLTLTFSLRRPAGQILDLIRRWLHQEHQKELPNVDHLISFLQSETELEERISIKTSQNASRKTKPIINVIHLATQDHCLPCKVSRHKFVDCDEFKKLSPQEQTNAMKRLHRCFTCLAPMHREPKTCRYRRRCLTYNKSHHRLLAYALNNSTCDIPVESPRPSHLSLNAEAPEFHENANSVSFPQDKKPNFKFSPSTYVELLGSDGTWHRAVALFGSGSDVTLIRRDIVKKS